MPVSLEPARILRAWQHSPMITNVLIWIIVDFAESSRPYPSVSGNIKLKTRSVGSIELVKNTKETPSCHAKSRNSCSIPFLLSEFSEIWEEICTDWFFVF